MRNHRERAKSRAARVPLTNAGVSCAHVCVLRGSAGWTPLFNNGGVFCAGLQVFFQPG